MNREVLKGFFVGLVAPIAAFVVYVAFFTDDAAPLAFYKKIVEVDKLSHVISLSLLINLLIFFMNIKTNRDEQARNFIRYTFLWYCHSGYKIILE